jgi:peptide/nickel transport system substrate-binding protein
MIERKSFWQRYARRRVSRRQALQLVAVGGGGLALAAACGGGGGGGEPTEGGPGQLINPEPDESIVPGGIYRDAFTGDPLTLDAQQNLSFTTDLFVSGFVYSRLYKYRTAPGYDPTLYDADPDVAESHEISDDGLTWTFTLRPGVKFHNKAPLNGRELDSEDVAETFRRFIELPARYEIVLRRTIDRVETPEPNRVVFHLKFPYAAFLNQMASATYLWILSKEAAAGDIDLVQPGGVIGTGPWVLEEYTPSQVIRYVRNPEWYAAPLPHLDGYTAAIVPEYATRQAQFLAGNLDSHAPNANDLIDVVNRTQGAQVTVGNFPNVLNFFFFDFNVNPDSPFRDERVRRAVSMAVDRDGLLEALYNLSVVQNAGYQMTARWHNVIPGGLTRWWLDPQGEAIGDAGQWYRYDPDAARALLAEAGYADGFSTEVHHPSAIYGSTFDQGAEAIIPFLRAVGISTETKQESYADYITRTFVGDLNGMAFALETPFSDPDEYLHAMYHPDGVRNHSKIDDPELTAMIEAQSIETDVDRRIEMVHDIQRYLSDKMYYVPLVVFGAPGLNVTQPWVRNVGVYQTASFGAGTEGLVYIGLDEDAPGRG